MTPAEVYLPQELSWRTMEGYTVNLIDRTAHIPAPFVAAHHWAIVEEILHVRALAAVTRRESRMWTRAKRFGRGRRVPIHP
jgi:hypothetical protein